MLLETCHISAKIPRAQSIGGTTGHVQRLTELCIVGHHAQRHLVSLGVSLEDAHLDFLAYFELIPDVLGCDGPVNAAKKKLHGTGKVGKKRSVKALWSSSVGGIPLCGYCL